MPSSWLHRSCDSLARSVFFFVPGSVSHFLPLPAPPRLCWLFLHWCFQCDGCLFLSFRVGAHGWVALLCQSWGALFQSRGWLPIVEVRGYSRHPTSILTMQLLTSCNGWFYLLNLFMKLLTMIERSNKSYWAALSGFQWYCLLCCTRCFELLKL